jgi:hypothetical protein
MNWFNKLFTKRPGLSKHAVAEAHRNARESLKTLQLALIKQLPPSAFPEAAKKLGLAKVGTIVIQQDDEFAVVYDHCIHHHRRTGKNIIERVIESDPSNEMLISLKNSFFSIFRVDDINPHLGAQITDLITGASHSLLDQSIADNGQENLLIVGRLVPISEGYISTGWLIPTLEPVFETRLKPIIERFKNTKDQLSDTQLAAMEGQILRVSLQFSSEDLGFFTDMDFT